MVIPFVEKALRISGYLSKTISLCLSVSLSLCLSVSLSLSLCLCLSVYVSQPQFVIALIPMLSRLVMTAV